MIVMNHTCIASLLRMPEMAGVTIAVWEKRLNLPLVVFHGAAAFCAAEQVWRSGLLHSPQGEDVMREGSGFACQVWRWQRVYSKHL
jgi:hypothetical protein